MRTMHLLSASFLRSALPLLAGCAVVALVFSQPILGLRCLDPPKSRTFRLTFTDSASGIMGLEGFELSSKGLSLDPQKKGTLLWQTIKQKGQGCLLRVWLYGAAEHPCALSVSLDGGLTYTPITSQGNLIGKVFDISTLAHAATTLQFRLTSENHAPYTALISDRLDVYIGSGTMVAPDLPDMILPCAAFLLAYYVAFALLNRRAAAKTVYRCIFCCIAFGAFYWRWHELVRVAGTALDPDAQGYLNFAHRLDLFGSPGFFSAQFGIREPLFLLTAKVFQQLFGFSETHLRFVSFWFSLLVVVLVWQLGKKWLAEPAGLIAAAILAGHPYLIELSARGLREEFFTCLLLLMLIIAGSRPEKLILRTAATGLLLGALALTRSETIPMAVLVLACLVIFSRRSWNPQRALAAFVIGILIYAPHLYGAYQQHGSPFYTMNIQARFYTNVEFAGQPGFPTQQELADGGMCSGPKITPFEYYFKLHTLRDLLTKSALGFIKITFSLPLSLAEGKGMQKKLNIALSCLQEKLAWTACSKHCTWISQLTTKNIAAYCLAALLLLSLVAGCIFMLIHKHFFISSCLVALQAHLSFLAGLGIDQRLGAHVYPVAALCCAYTFYCIGMWLHQKGLLRREAES